MNRTRLLGTVVFLMLAVVLFFAITCSANLNAEGAVKNAPSTSKPNPSVKSITTSTAGMGDNYYAIMEVAVKNEGAKGTVMVVGTITQGAQTIENSFPIEIKKNSEEVVTLVFKLKWMGGEFTANAEVQN
ncbi:MAG: hypothetical protein HY662_02680 [Chloroflexi bacterium]|nr:hypothetical protein [Chloroflexota bacterium]